MNLNFIWFHVSYICYSYKVDFAKLIVSYWDGALFCGLHVDNGRVGGKMKKALREVIEKYNLNVRITPNQNLILCGILGEDQLQQFLLRLAYW